VNVCWSVRARVRKSKSVRMSVIVRGKCEYEDV